MKTNVEALLALYLKLGGSLTDTYSDIAGGIPVGEYDLISDCILACAKKGAGGGGSLPEAGADGNVLTADDGEWVSAAPADATELQFALTIGESISCDVEVADIVNALEANRPVMGVVAGVGTLVVKTWNAELDKVVLQLYIPDGNKLTVVEFVGISGTPDVWTMDAPDEINGLPAVSGSDNGKVLGVSSGAFALISNSATTVIDVVSDGQGGYTASVNGSPITLAQMLTLAAAKTDMKVVCEVDNGRYISVPLISWDSSGAHFMGAAVVSDKPATAYAICEDEGSGEAWSVGIVQTT